MGTAFTDAGDPRSCGIASRLGHHVACPDGGCALLRALGEALPADPGAACPIDELAGADNELVLRTLDELRRDVERHPEWKRARTATQTRAVRHADTLRRWG